MMFFFICLLSSVFWSAFGTDVIQGQFAQFKPFICNNTAVCAISEPSGTFIARWRSQCTRECQHHRESCVGVNYLEESSTCEMFATKPTDYTLTETGCQYIQIQDKKSQSPECYEFGLQPWRLVASLTGTQGINTVVLLDDQLFVTRINVREVSVYDSTSLQAVRTISIPGVGPYLTGMAASTINSSYLYIGDNGNCKVHRVDLSVTNTVSVTSWSVPCSPNGVSVTSTGNVLVVSGSTIGEYTPSGSLVRTVSDSNGLWQAVEVENGLWAFSRKDPVYGITMIATNGTVVKRLGSVATSGNTQVNVPSYCMATDANGYMFVAGGNGILLVDPTWSVVRQITLPVSLAKPVPVVLDQSRGRLYIGEFEGQYRILMFSGI